ncbi:MAG: flagellar basal body rod C-terminal domain-containing protein, partial [Methylococcaceae bacterium]
AVLSEAGAPIVISSDSSLMVGKDGTLSYLVAGDNPVMTNFLGRIKLVNPSSQNLTRGNDGLFHASNGDAFSSDPNITVQSGALEESNINVVETMVAMISLGRQYDLQMDMLKNAKDDANKSSQIMSLT